jgi:hypothetical protein
LPGCARLKFCLKEPSMTYRRSPRRSCASLRDAPHNFSPDLNGLFWREKQPSNAHHFKVRSTPADAHNTSLGMSGAQ